MEWYCSLVVGFKESLTKWCAEKWIENWLCDMQVLHTYYIYKWANKGTEKQNTLSQYLWITSQEIPFGWGIYATVIILLFGNLVCYCITITPLECTDKGQKTWSILAPYGKLVSDCENFSRKNFTHESYCEPHVNAIVFVRCVDG